MKLLQQIALIACGQRENKTHSCAACASKAPALLRIASTGALNALAAAICGAHHSACQDCRHKARTIIDETMETPCTV
ncbi:hypothetical protein GCM10010329_78160 [Streptomyces spiroverticillatus]|uniref:Uncharacterized protein n=1 Tax=Streptomyces finlayi TaxID=67296 RepID=A0A918X577_9ACTN|nr:hypothetical protein [Streptomyces finlayi]GHA43621.1 hypothetical protein GCM10010329_78160 [Streptomyces spiroverticillatus]GHD13264.1 hypothetical protein GCM10010334_71190 [Streptomyces finlayi]